MNHIKEIYGLVHEINDDDNISCDDKRDHYKKFPVHKILTSCKKFVGTKRVYSTRNFLWQNAWILQEISGDKTREFYKKFPVNFEDFLGARIPGSPLKSCPLWNCNCMKLPKLSWQLSFKSIQIQSILETVFIFYNQLQNGTKQY